MLKSLIYTEPVKAFRVENMSAMGTPSSCALSLSTSKYSWGMSFCIALETPESSLHLEA